MGRAHVQCGRYRYVLEDVGMSAIAHGSQWPVVILGAPDDTPSAIVRLVVTTNTEDNDQRQLFVSVTDGPPSCVGAHSVVCVRDALVFVVGSFAVGISSASLAVLWTQRCDLGVCFGIYAVEDDNAVVVHGELEITKLSRDGKIVWQAAGRDIFTGPLTLQHDAVRVRDFYGATYAIQLATGDIKMIEAGTPYL